MTVVGRGPFARAMPGLIPTSFVVAFDSLAFVFHFFTSRETFPFSASLIKPELQLVIVVGGRGFINGGRGMIAGAI